MSIKRSIPYRLTASTLLALASLVSVPQAQAFLNGTIVTNNDDAPSWSVFMGSDCSAIQLTPHVAVSTRLCILDNSDLPLFYPKSLSFLGGWTLAIYEGVDSYRNVLGEVGLAILDPSLPATEAADILSYKEERQLLVDGNDDLTVGAKQVLVSGTPNDSSNDRRVTITQWYAGKGSEKNARPLIYRSVGRYHQLEPSRFDFYSPNPVFTPELLDNLYVQRNLNDRQVNAILLLTVGVEDDPSNDIVSPITDQDRGGGVFYKRADGRLALTGLISTSHVLTRLSHYWPWAYQQILRSGLKDEAIAFSQKVLGTGNWGSNDRQGQLGDIYVYDNPYNNEIEFFRLIRLGSEQRYWYFPTDKRDNYFWKYMGTSLPTIEEAVGPEMSNTPEQRSERSVVATASASAFPELDKLPTPPELIKPVTTTNASFGTEATAVRSPSIDRPQGTRLEPINKPTGNFSTSASAAPNW